MAKVLGVGGVFFKAQDREALGEWYGRWLGVPWTQWGAAFRPQAMPADAWTAWGPFAADTKYFDPSKKELMFNLVVDDLDGALAQVVEGGAELVDEIGEEEYGRFGWFLDPEGNKVELWEPAAGAWRIVTGTDEEE